MRRTQWLENTIASNSVASLGLAKDLQINADYVAKRNITDKNIKQKGTPALTCLIIEEASLNFVQ